MDELRDAWQDDSHFRRMVILAAIVGLIGFLFTLAELTAGRLMRTP